MCEKILVIDDEKDIANLLEVYLQNENYILFINITVLKMQYLVLKRAI